MKGVFNFGSARAGISPPRSGDSDDGTRSAPSPRGRAVGAGQRG